MPLYGLSIFDSSDDQHQFGLYSVAAVTDVISFGYFERKSVHDMITSVSKSLADRASVGARTTTSRSESGVNFAFHVHRRADGLCGIVAGDKSYPAHVAFDLIDTFLADFSLRFPQSARTGMATDTPYPQLRPLLEKYQNPESVDDLAQMQRGIQETTDAMHSNMSSILNRGGKIEHLVKQSDNLITPSKMFKREIQGIPGHRSRKMAGLSKAVLLLTFLAMVAFAIATFVLNTMVQTDLVVLHPKAGGAATVIATFGVIKTHFAVNVAGMGPASVTRTSRGLGGCGLANEAQHWPFAERNQTTSDDPLHLRGEDFGPWPLSLKQEAAAAAAAATSEDGSRLGASSMIVANSRWTGSSSDGGGGGGRGSDGGGRGGSSSGHNGRFGTSSNSSGLGFHVPSFVGVIFGSTYIVASVCASIAVTCISKRPFAAPTHAFVALVLHSSAAAAYGVFLWRWVTAGNELDYFTNPRAGGGWCPSEEGVSLLEECCKKQLGDAYDARHGIAITHSFGNALYIAFGGGCLQALALVLQVISSTKIICAIGASGGMRGRRRYDEGGNGSAAGAASRPLMDMTF